MFHKMSVWNDYVEGSISNVSSSNDFRKLLIKIYKSKMSPKYDEKECYKAIQGRVYSLSNEINHLCTPYCTNHPSWCNDSNLINKITDIYISNYLNIHCCSENCNAKKEFSDGFQTCVLSGMRYPCTNWVNSYKRLHEYHRTSSTTVRVETSALRACARKLITRLLFSDIRIQAERKKVHDLKKEITKMWIKHKRQCDKKKDIVKLNDLLVMASAAVNKKINKKYVLPDASTQELICNFYVDRICEFYLKLKSLTNFTVHNAQNSVSDAFCTAVLFVMRSGLRINDFYVVAKDFFLDIILPEANSLDNFSLHKTHFTAARNHIMASIRDAVHIYHVNPNKLFLCSLQAD